MRELLRVLMVEDSEDDALLIANELQRGGYEPVYTRVETPGAMRTNLVERSWDIIFADYSMPHFSGPAALHVLLESGLDIPLITVSATVSEEEAIEMMRSGARDFVLKRNLNRLAPAVRRELREAQMRRERREAREALAEREAHYRLIMETATDGIITIGADDRILSANPAVEEIFGYRIHELIGQSLTILMPERYRERHVNALNAYIKTNVRHISWNGVEFPGLRKDGQEVALEIAYGAFRREGHLIVVGIIRDITDRKRAQEQLRASEETFRTVFNSVYDAIFLHDREGNIIDVNNRMLAIYDVTREEALRMSITNDFSAPDNQFQLLPGLWQDVMEGHPHLFEWRARRPHDGSEFDVEVYLRELTVEGRHVIMANIRDITERKSADRARNQFLSVLSHELRTPLTNILGWVKEAQTEPEIIPEALRIIEKNADIQRRMLENLLEVSRLIHGKLILQQQAIDFWPIAYDVLNRITPRAIEKHIQITVVLPSQPAVIYADRKRLHEVIENVLDNAIRFTDTGGKINVTGDQDKERISLLVRDTGRGISAERLPHIFDLFLATTKSDATEGLGVGLPLTRAIITMHGGELKVVSAGEGQGTTVTITLPLRSNL